MTIVIMTIEEGECTIKTSTLQFVTAAKHTQIATDVGLKTFFIFKFVLLLFYMYFP